MRGPSVPELTMQVRVHGVKPDQKVTQSVLLGSGDLGQQCGNDLFSGRELAGVARASQLYYLDWTIK